jgi:hypothetical protein
VMYAKYFGANSTMDRASLGEIVFITNLLSADRQKNDDERPCGRHTCGRGCGGRGSRVAGCG